MEGFETDVSRAVLVSAVDSITHVGVPLIPFAIVEKAGHRSIHRFVTEDLEDGAVQVRAYAQGRTDADRLAFAIDSFIRIEGRRRDAIVVERWEIDTREVIQIAQPYEIRGFLRRRGHATGDVLTMADGVWG